MVVIPYERYLKYTDNLNKYMDNSNNLNKYMDNPNNLNKYIDNSNKTMDNCNKSSPKIDRNVIENVFHETQNISDCLDETHCKKFDEIETQSKKFDEIDKIINSNVLLEEEILKFIPKSYHHQSRMILNHMMRNNMRWDCYGRLILGDDCVMNTHIVDLIRYSVCNYKRRLNDKNVLNFIELLKVTHCPHSAFAQKYLENEAVNEKRKTSTT